jgi:exonuclease VII small subunit
MPSHSTAVLRSEAQRLASAGSHQAALELLDQLPAPEGAALRARIYCQQGLFTKGARWWQEVLAADSGNEEARQALALAEGLARSPLGMMRLHARRWILTLLAVAAVATGLAAWRAGSPGRSDSNRELAGSLERLRERVEALDSISRETADTVRRLERAESAAAQSQEHLKGQLQRVQQSLRRMEKNLGGPTAR